MKSSDAKNVHVHMSISPIGIILYSCLYNTQEDIKHILVIKILREVWMYLLFYQRVAPDSFVDGDGPGAP